MPGSTVAGGVPLLELTPRRVLYEDADLIAVDKPAGLVAHATVDPARDHLLAAIARMLQARDGRVAHLVAHHRLDRDTSGVVLCSKNPEVDAALGSAFASRSVGKTYLAIVRGAAVFPDGEVEIAVHLAPGKGPGGRTTVVRSGGRPARTRVMLLRRAGDLLLVRAQPLTGRTHQIRVHLAHLGFPIVGDDLYGGSDPDTKRLLLHARTLELPHPRTGAPLSISAPLPRAFRSRFSDAPA